MIVYLDGSAAVKRYVTESNSAEVIAMIGGAAAVATSMVSRAEVAGGS